MHVHWPPQEKGGGWKCETGTGLVWFMKEEEEEEDWRNSKNNTRSVPNTI
jgi:hypothetical protein